MTPALQAWPRNGTDTAPAAAGRVDVSGCPDCATLQRVPLAQRGSVLRCTACRSLLERTAGRNITVALCFTAAALLLLVPANTLTFLTTTVAGVSRSSLLASSATYMASDGFPELALVIGLFVVVFPVLRFALLATVLGALQAGWRPPWLGRVFRWSQNLQTWAMADVFLLGFVVAYSRLETMLTVDMGPGAMCFIAAAILTLLTRATLDTAAVWRAIASDRTPPTCGAAVLACGGCHLLLPATLQGGSCPRCAATLQRRKPGALRRATALALAAAVLYVPANLYPMAALPIGFATVEYTVLEGVIDLVDAGLWGLAVLVLLASFVVPMLKLAALAWFIVSVLRRSGRQLVLKTRLYRVVDEIGRWSMVDPFVIACFVPVTQYNTLVSGSAQPAAPMFAAVVILTTLAAHAFDPRLLWDAGARSQRGNDQTTPR